MKPRSSLREFQAMNQLVRFFEIHTNWRSAIIAAYAMAIFGIAHKSVTFDEIGHLAGGYAIWQKGDFRLVPDNGNLSQRLQRCRHVAQRPPSERESGRVASLKCLYYRGSILFPVWQ